MTLLLLPKFGAGGQAWAPGLTAVSGRPQVATTDSEVTNNTLSVTGTNAITTGVLAGTYNGLRLKARLSQAMNPPIKNQTLWSPADGAARLQHTTQVDGCNVNVYAGWPVLGIWAAEVDASFANLPVPIDLQLNVNPYTTAYAWGSPVRKSVTLNGNTYELVTLAAWATTAGHAQDTWPASNWYPQFTVTIVPYEASLNAVGVNALVNEANSFSGNTSGGNAQIRCSKSKLGGTVYFSMSKATVDAVQTWIAADLVENTDFVSPPLTRSTTANHLYAASANAVLRAGTVALFGAPLGGMPVTGVPPSSVSAQLAANPQGFTSRPYIGGPGKVSGQVTVNNAAVGAGYRVQVFRKRDNLLMGEVFTDASGNYTYVDLDRTYTYYVVAHDPTGVYNAVIQDSITPVAYP
ncbi:hypothetical protein RA280_14460 [Cupriavidus sp. CV2]|uniref:hypothetical protein n=1 Tax=Cupriavidus ulmosensis TaxID=3065913 RepID=UPI00296AACC9|nr:hypothetical protein [Cupriavidus sp. CV2]MDW3682928.1 hypothetical protein [Cupriavidus sp. CV2]